jgi:hypothetical protein
MTSVLLHDFAWCVLHSVEQQSYIRKKVQQISDYMSENSV